MNPINPTISTSHHAETSVSQEIQDQLIFTNASLLPRVLRVLKIKVIPHQSIAKHFQHQAVLFARGLQIAVEWTSKNQQSQILPLSLVTIVYKDYEPIKFNQVHLTFLVICILVKFELFHSFKTSSSTLFSQLVLIKVAAR